MDLAGDKSQRTFVARQKSGDKRRTYVNRLICFTAVHSHTFVNWRMQIIVTLFVG